MRGWTTGAALMITLLLSAPTHAAKIIEAKPRAAPEPDMTIDDDGHGGYVVTVENPLPFAITVTLKAKKLENLQSSKPLPLTTVVDAHQTTPIANMTPIESHEATKIDTQYQWQPGRPDAKHDDSFVYTLPFEAGYAYRVGQGYNGEYSHQNENSLDFNMPEGTPVCAARDGRVVSVTQTYSEGGTNPKLREKCNEFSILHDDGTIATYAHLKKDGIELKVGDQVRAGYPLGKSGNTGFSSGPHLHFSVSRVIDGGKSETIATKFQTTDGDAATLEAKHLYMRPFNDQAKGERRDPKNSKELVAQISRSESALGIRIQPTTRMVIIAACFGAAVLIVIMRTIARA
jgi:murein DD-endopeptidase MepM/ murein hydrolase activator NlpD